MQLNVPPDLEALVQKRLDTGAFANAEDVIRRALETLDAEESWSDEERSALDEKIDRALEQVAAGRVYGPEEARRKASRIERDAPSESGLKIWTHFNLLKMPFSILTPSGFTSWKGKVGDSRPDRYRTFQGFLQAS